MKKKIETAANVVVIVLAIVVGSVFLKDRFLTSPSQTDSIKIGDELPNVKGWDWAAHKETLLLVLRKGCHFCEDSMPFYERLSAQESHAGKVSIVAAFPDNPATVRDLAKAEGLAFQMLPDVPLESLRISGTPTLLLIDGKGTILNIWAGMLSPKQELEVMNAIKAPTAGAKSSS